MVRRWSAKVDANQSAMVRELRSMGYDVLLLHRVGSGCPDLLIAGYLHRINDFANVLVEVKTSDKSRLTPQEIEFRNNWRGPRLTAVDAIEVQSWFEGGGNV
jgi:hypothetical protein